MVSGLKTVRSASSSQLRYQCPKASVLPSSALLGAIPIPDPKQNRERERVVVTGEPPNPINPPSGCRFHTRCPRAQMICRVEPPHLEPAPGRPTQLAACHFKA